MLTSSKIGTMFIKTIIKDLVKKNQNNSKICIKMQSISGFLDVTKVLISREKNTVSRTQGVCYVIYLL